MDSSLGSSFSWLVLLLGDSTEHTFLEGRCRATWAAPVGPRSEEQQRLGDSLNSAAHIIQFLGEEKLKFF
jgi:hypothetical protein